MPSHHVWYDLILPWVEPLWERDRYGRLTRVTTELGGFSRMHIIAGLGRAHPRAPVA